MGTIQGLFTLAVRQVVDGACAAVGVSGGGEAIVGFLSRHFTDHSQRLTAALQAANNRAWKALEITLVGDSLKDRLAGAEDRELRQQMRSFLDASPGGIATADLAFRKRCVRDLRAARKSGKLVSPIDPQALAREASALARFGDPQAVLDGERKVLAGMAREFAGDYPDLARLLELEPQPGRSLLVVAVRYFFRRAVEEDQRLSQGLAFAKLERLGEAQENGFAALDASLTRQGQRLETLLHEIQILVVETHEAVLDLQGQIVGQGEQVRQIGQAVQKLLEQHQLQQRELRPGDSLSIRNDNERQLVKQLVARYRGLPDGDRKKVPALLNAIGKLEVVAGDFDAAQKDFQAVAQLEQDTKAQAEAHFNAYLASLEKRDWPGAIQELVKAVKLDAKRFAPFPVGKYLLKKILGAGGFGVAFLCKHKYMNADVVVKTLTSRDWGPGAGEVFNEAQILRELDHPAIIRISECGYTDPAGQSRPFLVMDFFEGMTLDRYVMEKGTLRVDQLLWVAGPVAEALQAAHAKGILHRDVKPANILVKKDQGRWSVKVIDFGLAVRQKSALAIAYASTSKRSQTRVGRSIAGTADFAAPEQMGRRDEPVGPYSDIYGWAKVCCYAVFQTTQPLRSHWSQLSRSLADLLEGCLTEDPARRPQTFTTVLEMLDRVGARSASGWRCSPQIRSTGANEEPRREAEADDHRLKSRKKREKGKKRWSPLVVGIAAALLLTLTAVVVGWMMFRSKSASPVAGGSSAADTTLNKPESQRPDSGDSSRRNDRPDEEKGAKGIADAFVNDIDIQLVRIPGGTFRMGSSQTMQAEAIAEHERIAGGKGSDHFRSIHRAEGPQHLVEVSPFHLGVYEVTQKQFRSVMGYNPSYFSKKPKGKPAVRYRTQPGGGADRIPRGEDTEDYPVENVTWEEANEFSEKLTTMDSKKPAGWKYRLPTEAEWEYACRAGVRSQGFHFGNSLSTDQANFGGNLINSKTDKFNPLNRSCPVGRYEKNAFGLHDMHGNVWEWCHDWYAADYYVKCPSKDPPGPASGSVRVFRGGGWESNSSDCRSAYRNGHAPTGRPECVGFRVALVPLW